MSEITLKTLQAAAKGLLYPSEQDRPIKAFLWPKADLGGAAFDEAAVRKLAGIDPAAKGTTQSVADFFAPLTGAAQFQALQTLLQSLTGLTVYRFGDTDIQVYAVGTTTDGDAAGINTRVTET